MAIDKSTWNLKTKVSQSTIDDIKKMGMKESLKLAALNSTADQGGLVGEFAEGVRRMYGDKRFQTAIHKTYPTDKPTMRSSRKP